MNSPQLILDIQFFKNGQNKFIPKELAAFNGHRVSHYVFKSPFPFENLPVELRKQNNWLTANLHGLNWTVGFTPFYQFKKIMASLTENEDVIFVKGREKAEFIRKFTRRQVLELPEHPALPDMEPKCFNHIRSTCKCALTNVYYLYDTFFQ